MYIIKKAFWIEYFGERRWNVLHSVKLMGNTIFNINNLCCHYQVSVIATGSNNTILSIRLSKLNDRVPP